MDIKQIDIFVRVLQQGAERKGQAIILYRFGGRVKEVYMTIFQRTQNRSIIHASTLAIEGLKEPCVINLYVQSNFGFSFMKNQKKWVNRDMGVLLTSAIISGGHEVKYIDCSATDEGKDHQNNLSAKLRKVNK